MSFQVTAKVRFAALLSTACALWLTLVSLAAAHEVFPTIVDMTQDGDVLTFDVGVNVGANLEGFVAGVDFSSVLNTDEAAQAARYDALRLLPAGEFEQRVRDFWPEMAGNITVLADGEKVSPQLVSLVIPDVGNTEEVRQSLLTFAVDLPAGAQVVQFGWAAGYGEVVLRQQGVEAGFADVVGAGGLSPEIALQGGGELSAWQAFVRYIPDGFDHIVPKGLDHILFVLGLFFLSAQMRPLLWQISAFTVAHTITLALATLGYVTISPEIIEPLIAASIVYVAVENIFAKGLSPWRPVFIFALGLLHGLGFASVLAEFGLPENNVIPALIGFNVGVEIGQLAVIAVAFLCVKVAIDFDRTDQASKPLAAAFLVGMVAVMALVIPIQAYDLSGDLLPLIVMVSILLGLSAAAIAAPRFDNYREMVAMPASILIAVVAAYWCVERVFLG